MRLRVCVRIYKGRACTSVRLADLGAAPAACPSIGQEWNSDADQFRCGGKGSGTEL